MQLALQAVKAAQGLDSDEDEPVEEILETGSETGRKRFKLDGTEAGQNLEVQLIMICHFSKQKTPSKDWHVKHTEDKDNDNRFRTLSLRSTHMGYVSLKDQCKPASTSNNTAGCISSQDHGPVQNNSALTLIGASNGVINEWRWANRNSAHLAVLRRRSALSVLLAVYALQCLYILAFSSWDKHCLAELCTPFDRQGSIAQPTKGQSYIRMLSRQMQRCLTLIRFRQCTQCRIRCSANRLCLTETQDQNIAYPAMPDDSKAVLTSHDTLLLCSCFSTIIQIDNCLIWFSIFLEHVKQRPSACTLYSVMALLCWVQPNINIGTSCMWMLCIVPSVANKEPTFCTSTNTMSIIMSLNGKFSSICTIGCTVHICALLPQSMADYSSP